MSHIIFVCTGNICRSPMAEGMFRQRLASQEIAGVTVSSMGTHGQDNAPASDAAQEVCRAQGIDISGHRSRAIVGSEIAEATWMFCMTPEQQRFLHTFHPWHRDRIVLMAAWPGKPRRRSVVPDPYGRSRGFYRKVYKQMAGHLDRIWQALYG